MDQAEPNSHHLIQTKSTSRLLKLLIQKNETISAFQRKLSGINSRTTVIRV